MNPPNITPHDLAAYALGEGDEASRARIESHLQDSPRSAALLDRLRTLIATLRDDGGADAPRRAVERAVNIPQRERPGRVEQILSVVAEAGREILAVLVADASDRTALPGFRGTCFVRHLAFECDAAEIDVQVTPDTRTPSRRSVRGQVSPRHGGELRAVTWSVAGGGSSGHTVTLGARGTFALECETGTYELRAVVDDTLVRTPPIDVP